MYLVALKRRTASHVMQGRIHMYQELQTASRAWLASTLPVRLEALPLVTVLSAWLGSTRLRLEALSTRTVLTARLAHILRQAKSFAGNVLLVGMQM